MTLPNKTIAKILQAFIISPAVSNREIARRVGCSETTVRRLRGKRKTQIDIVVYRGLVVPQEYTMRYTPKD